MRQPFACVVLLTALALGAAPALTAPVDPNGSAGSADTGTPPPSPPLRDRIYFGGSIGLAFGDVDYWEIAPTVGFRVTPKFSTGLGLFYLHREDSRYERDFSSDDYGLGIFGIYRPVPPFFLQAEYAWTRFEYLLPTGETVNDSHSGLLAGAGFVQSLGGRASFIVSALYDFNYVDDEPSPYDNPWTYRAGVVFGF